MPNVLIIGFKPRKAKKIRDLVEGILRQTGRYQKSYTTIINAQVAYHILNSQTCLKSGRFDRMPAPYVLVRDEKLHVARQVARALHEVDIINGPNLDVEYEKIGGFFSARSKKL